MDDLDSMNVYQIEVLDKLKGEYRSTQITHSKIDDLSLKYPFYRKVRGDGNCYYRAVMFQYIETIIYEGQDSLQAFINLLNSDCSFFEFSDKSIVTILTTNLYHIKEILEKKGLNSALKRHFDLIMSNYEYDLAYIKMLRSAIATFLELNRDIKSEGRAFNEIENPIESFISNIVLKNGEPPQSIILQVAPLVLRIQINIVVLTDDVDTEVSDGVYSATHPDISFVKSDGIDWHEKCISIIFYKKNYNAIYSVSTLEKYPEIACYDTAMLTCAICEESNPDEKMDNLHNHLAHYSCYMNLLKNEEFRKCPICMNNLQLEEIKMFANEKDFIEAEKGLGTDLIHNSEKSYHEEKKIPDDPNESKLLDKNLIIQSKNDCEDPGIKPPIENDEHQSSEKKKSSISEANQVDQNVEKEENDKTGQQFKRLPIVEADSDSENNGEKKADEIISLELKRSSIVEVDNGSNINKNEEKKEDDKIGKELERSSLSGEERRSENNGEKKEDDIISQELKRSSIVEADNGSNINKNEEKKEDDKIGKELERSSLSGEERRSENNGEKKEDDIISQEFKRLPIVEADNGSNINKNEEKKEDDKIGKELERSSLSGDERHSDNNGGKKEDDQINLELKRSSIVEADNGSNINKNEEKKEDDKIGKELERSSLSGEKRHSDNNGEKKEDDQINQKLERSSIFEAEHSSHIFINEEKKEDDKIGKELERSSLSGDERHSDNNGGKKEDYQINLKLERSSIFEVEHNNHIPINEEKKEDDKIGKELERSSLSGKESRSDNGEEKKEDDQINQKLERSSLSGEERHSDNNGGKKEDDQINLKLERSSIFEAEHNSHIFINEEKKEDDMISQKLERSSLSGKESRSDNGEEKKEDDIISQELERSSIFEAEHNSHIFINEEKKEDKTISQKLERSSSIEAENNSHNSKNKEKREDQKSSPYQEIGSPTQNTGKNNHSEKYQEKNSVTPTKTIVSSIYVKSKGDPLVNEKKKKVEENITPIVPEVSCIFVQSKDDPSDNKDNICLGNITPEVNPDNTYLPAPEGFEKENSTSIPNDSQIEPKSTINL